MYMDVKIKLNGKLIIDSVDQDMVLLDFCRKHSIRNTETRRKDRSGTLFTPNLPELHVGNSDRKPE